jgi:hypothetical protein
MFFRSMQTFFGPSSQTQLSQIKTFPNEIFFHFLPGYKGHVPLLGKVSIILSVVLYSTCREKTSTVRVGEYLVWKIHIMSHSQIKRMTFALFYLWFILWFAVSDSGILWHFQIYEPLRSTYVHCTPTNHFFSVSPPLPPSPNLNGPSICS